MSINRACISGNLTRDPEMRTSGNGTAILNLSVAVNDRRKNPQTNQWEDRPNFIDCVMFGARAEGVEPYLSKGSKVAVEGKLRQSRWETNAGEHRSKIEVLVDEIEFLSRGEDRQPRPTQPARAPQSPPQQPEAQPYAPEVYDEDIPF